MTAVSGFSMVNEDGHAVAADPHGNNVAFRCASCGGPVLAVMLEHQRGSAAEKPTSCGSCHSTFWVEVIVAAKQLILHRLNPQAKSPEVFAERIRTWSDLTDLVEHFSYFNRLPWLYRGVRNAGYGLVPKVGRDTRKKKANGRIPYRLEDERAAFEMFKQQAHPYLSSHTQTDLELLAIAQHFGMPTRLLDWTDSLLVAAWFAVELGGSEDHDSAIWVARGIPKAPDRFQDDPLAPGGQMIFYRPPHITPRISAQSSVFVLCPDPQVDIKPEFVRKILIDPKAQFTLKKRLSASGVNRRTLFPDLAGLSDHIDWLYKNNWLTPYWSDCRAEQGSED